MRVVWTQPFHWGVLLAHDEDADVTTPRSDGSSRIAATRSCLVVPVRHSQDVDALEGAGTDDVLPEAEVRVTVLVGAPLTTGVEFSGRLRCPSGRLVVGDADQQRVIEVPAGDLAVQVARDATDHAEHVSIVLVALPARRSFLARLGRRQVPSP